MVRRNQMRTPSSIWLPLNIIVTWDVYSSQCSTHPSPITFIRISTTQTSTQVKCYTCHDRHRMCVREQWRPEKVRRVLKECWTEWINLHFFWCKVKITDWRNKFAWNRGHNVSNWQHQSEIKDPCLWGWCTFTTVSGRHGRPFTKVWQPWKYTAPPAFQSHHFSFPPLPISVHRMELSFPVLLLMRWNFID